MNPTSRGSGSTSSVGNATDSRATLLIPIALAAAVVGVGFVGLLIWDAWFVNHDGTFYMALAHNLRHGAGYVFPDGSVATFRGPGYPGLLAAGWLVFEETARSAIWVSRAAGLLVPAAVALLLWRWTKAWWVALSVGIVAAVQPWVLISGAQFFAPDGFGFGLTLVALLVVFWSPAELLDARRLRIAGVVLGLAFVVKDPLLLVALVPVGVIALHREGGLRSAVTAAAVLAQGWLVLAGPWFLYSLLAGDELPAGFGSLSGVSAWIVLAAVAFVPFLVPRLIGGGGPVLPLWAVAPGTFALALAAYVVMTAVDVGRVTELWAAIRADLQAQLYRDSGWGLLLPASALALAWAVARRRQVAVQAATLLALVGLAALVFTSLSGSGMRNAVLLPYALLLLLGLAVDGLAAWRGWTIAPSLLLLVSAFFGSAQASVATNDRPPVESLTAEAPATVEAARWLQSEAAGGKVVGTSLYLQSMWRLGGGSDPWYLLPSHVMSADRWEAGDRAFDRRETWAGSEAVEPTGEIGIAYTLNRTRTGAYLPETVAESLEGVGYLVVTGNALFPGSAFDGGGLLPSLEATEGLTPVWRSPADSDQWVIIYRFDGSLLPGSGPSIIQLATDADIPNADGNQVVLTSAEYQVMVRGILARPIEP